MDGSIRGDTFMVSASNLLGTVCYRVVSGVTHSALTMHLFLRSCCQGSVIVDILTASERKPISDHSILLLELANQEIS